jgi:predicted subunit of tRNA(5-methylaminomethyl-2-thiouridylate) methyltransferase
MIANVWHSPQNQPNICGIMVKKKNCLLMFSGGRDSTIAAVRLAKRFTDLTLVTVSSDHLVGISAVKRRIEQIKPHLSSESEWLQVDQP